MVEAAKNVALKQLTFVEPVKPRTVKHMLPALARMYSRIRALGLPLYIAFAVIERESLFTTSGSMGLGVQFGHYDVWIFFQIQWTL